jgi:hypothetical protein
MTITQRVVEGFVEATNPRGIRVDGAWYNFSKYAQVPTPPVGALVRLTLREKWIHGLEILEAPVETPPETEPPAVVAETPVPSPVPVPEAGTPETPPEPPTSGEPEPALPRVDLRDRRVARAVALRAAVDLLAGRPQASVEAVLRAAEVFEAWLLR